MTSVPIPRAVFDDLYEQAEALFESPQCACFLAVGAALPTETARQHLGLMRDRAQLVRIDVRHFMEQHRVWAYHVLPSHDERTRLIESASDFGVYVHLKATQDSRRLRALLAPILIELATMAWLRHRVVFGSPARLGVLFQRAAYLLRSSRLSTDSEPGSQNPVGQVWCDGTLRHISDASRLYAEEVRAGRVPFEHFRASHTTQLRLLLFLMLAISDAKPWSLPMLHATSNEERSVLLRSFGQLLDGGLLSDPPLRDEHVQALVGASSFPMERQEPFLDAHDSWLAWLSGEGGESSVAFRRDIFRALAPSASPEKLAGYADALKIALPTVEPSGRLFVP